MAKDDDKILAKLEEETWIDDFVPDFNVNLPGLLTEGSHLLKK